MSFFLQLKLLVWKNYTLRKRQWVGICLVIKMWKYSEYNMYHFQGRLIVEIVWPLILFLILFLVRLRGLKKYHHECKFKSFISFFKKKFNEFYFPKVTLKRRWCHQLGLFHLPRVSSAHLTIRAIKTLGRNLGHYKNTISHCEFINFTFNKIERTNCSEWLCPLQTSSVDSN